VEVIITPDKNKAALLAARLIAKELKAKPDLVMALAAGLTMEPVYRYLAMFHRLEGLDFSQCRTFSLDEYIGISPEQENSSRHYFHKHLFQHVNIPPSHVHQPDGMARDLKRECEKYEALIQASGGIDLQLLGIGVDGHIGFNEPLSALLSRTREKALTPTTIQQNAMLFGGDASMVPPRAITMGVGTILDSRRCLLLVTGAAKTTILAQAVEGPITSMVTASALQLHPHCQVVVDDASAAELKGRDYYRWIFLNEAHWTEFHDLEALEPREGA